MTWTTRSVLLTAFAATALVGCDERRDAVSTTARVSDPPAATSAPATSAPSAPVAPANQASTTTSAPIVSMTSAPHVNGGRPLPLAIDVRGAARFERATDGTRRVRIDVHVVNRFDRPAICERTLFHARDGETQLVADSAASTIDEVMPLGPSQEFGGDVAFVVPEGSAAPRRITLTYGMADEQVLESIAVE